MTQLISLILALWSLGAFGVAHAGPASAAKLAYLKPVELISVQSGSIKSGSVKVAYRLACGESFRGILMDEAQSLVEIGAIVDRSDTFCLSLPERREIIVPIGTRKALASFSLKDPKRIVLSEASDITFSKSGLSVSWQDSCRQLLGFVLTPMSTADGRPVLGLSVAHLPKEGLVNSSQTQCGRQMKRKQLSSLQLSAETLQVNQKPGRLEDLYALRLVAPSAIRTETDGALSLDWQRSCRETPVGVLFLGRDGSDVAIVSALTPNAPCVGPKKVSSTYRLTQLSIPETQELRPLSTERARSISSESKYSFRMQSITSLKIPRRGTGLWTMASAAPTCGERLGVVVGADAHGNLAMSVLADGRNKICSVSRTLSSGTLTVPLAGPADGPLPKVFALKVFGTPIN